ncbi:hypothetical protein FRC01_000575 [Tulasnella sp. 417]|nr:hypothetical protein FRC01_000575 [Tulasnella sp. 417]
MNAATQNTLTAPVFEIPDPPEEFGQDGGKFYRCYDAVADEIDEDMVKGLKEQLDGMLIFAGLFAGVNSAFLGLTIPLLSADPVDDTNALLAQNNAILTQLVMGRNDSLHANPILPSAAFSPTRDIFMINALFALSLAFAIMSSFLAVLGRQWLVYYRKRSGGGPDRQRWEQLKRFLGAELLPLSRAWKALRETLPIFSTVLGDKPLGRTEENLELLQIISLSRTICISDEPITLLHAMANLMGFKDTATMERLWGEITFRQRLLELFQNASNVGLQLRGYNADPRESAASARRLYCSAVAHTLLTIDIDWGQLRDFQEEVGNCKATTVFPSPLPGSPPSLIGPTLGFSVLRLFHYTPSLEEFQSICNSLVVYSDLLAKSLHRMSFSVFLWVVSQLPELRAIEKGSIGSLRIAYRGVRIQEHA